MKKRISRWKGSTQTERTEFMRGIAFKKWSTTTKEQRADYAQKMLKARWTK